MSMPYELTVVCDECGGKAVAHVDYLFLQPGIAKSPSFPEGWVRNYDGMFCSQRCARAFRKRQPLVGNDE